MIADWEWSEFLEETMRRIVGEELWIRSAGLTDEEVEEVIFRTLFRTYKIEEKNCN